VRIIRGKLGQERIEGREEKRREVGMELFSRLKKDHRVVSFDAPL
jgi:hypothetical protein